MSPETNKDKYTYQECYLILPVDDDLMIRIFPYLLNVSMNLSHVFKHQRSEEA